MDDLFAIDGKMDKNKQLIRCLKKMDKSRRMLAKNKGDEARMIYAKAREIYLNLEYADKKEVYGPLNDLYERMK